MRKTFFVGYNVVSRRRAGGDLVVPAGSGMSPSPSLLPRAQRYW
jgi:hypothetical protein